MCSLSGKVTAVDNAKIAVFTCALDNAVSLVSISLASPLPTLNKLQQTETKGTVLLNNADELLNYSASEEKAVQQVASRWTRHSLNPLW